MKSPRPLEIPTVKVFQPEELRLIKYPLAYLKAVPQIPKKSSYASHLNNLLGELDTFATSHTGLDGLPILLKKRNEYIAVSGHASINAAKILNIPIICNVYAFDKFAGVVDKISLIKAYILPTVINLVCLAHTKVPLGAKGHQLAPLPYIIAALLENFCGIKSDMSGIIPKSFFESYESLEKFGMASRSTLNRLVKKYRLLYKNTADPKPLGQSVHPELHVK